MPLTDSSFGSRDFRFCRSPATVMTCVSQWMKSSLHTPQLSKSLIPALPSLRPRIQSFKRALSLPGSSAPLSVRALHFNSSAHGTQRSESAPRPEPATPIRFSPIRSLLPSSFLAKTTPKPESPWQISLQVLMQQGFRQLPPTQTSQPGIGNTPLTMPYFRNTRQHNRQTLTAQYIQSAISLHGAVRWT